MADRRLPLRHPSGSSDHETSDGSPLISPRRALSSSPSLVPGDSAKRSTYGSPSNSILTSHRQSFSDSLRGHPPSPGARRKPSFTQAALQELLDNPPVASPGDPAFVGRDWKSIAVGELIDDRELLIDSGASVILIRASPQDNSACGTFEYSDLNAYLLLVTGLAHPEESEIHSFQELARKAREGNKIPIKDVKDLGKKEPLVALAHTAPLTKAVEILGSGVHRIVILKEGSIQVLGILSQLQVVKFLWENGKSFPVIDQLCPHYIRDLAIGSQQVMSINGDKPLTDALELLNSEGVSSLAVVDNKMNVVGNISTVDVRHLTRSSSLPLLQSSCIHFISVILSDRGVNDGKDSFPVFYINPMSTLAHTVAKLVATKSHRMWVVESPSPASSTPPTPVTQPAVLVPPPGLQTSTPASAPPFTVGPAPSVSSAALPGAHMSGRLTGVVSLSDILNLFARSSGLSPVDPNEMRRQRRRSSSSSVHRPSMDSARSSSADVRRI
ncbi:MAG: cell separation during budding [Thelocarpon impressellum]|nr:MAG: cell separation during budding [Thelocarpon impressellum]